LAAIVCGISEYNCNSKTLYRVFSAAQLPLHALHRLNATDRGFGAWLALVAVQSIAVSRPAL